MPSATNVLSGVKDLLVITKTGARGGKLEGVFRVECLGGGTGGPGTGKRGSKKKKGQEEKI